jgi:hypothetical protein
MVPSYPETLQMLRYQQPLLARMILTIEIRDDDVTMIVEIVMVIEEIKEVVEVVGVVDKSTSLETQVHPVSLVVSLT